jgi:hypothetical protein
LLDSFGLFDKVTAYIKDEWFNLKTRWPWFLHWLLLFLVLPFN